MGQCIVCETKVYGRKVYCDDCKSDRSKRKRRVDIDGYRGVQRRDETVMAVKDRLERRHRLRAQGYEDPDDVALEWING